MFTGTSTLKKTRATIAVMMVAAMLAACGTKGPLYLPKKEPVPAAKPEPAKPVDPVPETTDKPGL